MADERGIHEGDSPEYIASYLRLKLWDAAATARENGDRLGLAAANDLAAEWGMDSFGEILKADAKTALYRHFDKAGNLLYVGVSLSIVDRTRAHSEQASWFSDIARIDVEWFANRGEAETAETAAIVKERPIHNIAKKPFRRYARAQKQAA